MGHLRDIKKAARQQGYSGHQRYIRFGGRGIFVGHWLGGDNDITLYNAHKDCGNSQGFSGHGVVLNPANGREYIGEWKNGVLVNRTAGTPTQSSVAILHDIDIYEGDLVEGVPNGYGELTFGNYGSIISKYGKQRFPFPTQNLDRYEGQFSNGLPHGSGKLIWHHGVEYEGTFNQGRKEGLFTLRLPKGITVQAEFSHDTLQRYKVTGPAYHPLRSDTFQNPTISTNSANSRTHMYLGDPNGQAIQLAPDGSFPILYYAGEHRDAVACGQGVRGYFTPGYCVLETGNFWNYALDGEGEKSEITERGLRSFADTALTIETLTGHFTEGKSDGILDYTKIYQRPYKHVTMLKRVFNPSYNSDPVSKTQTYEAGNLVKTTTDADSKKSFIPFFSPFTRYEIVTGEGRLNRKSLFTGSLILGGADLGDKGAEIIEDVEQGNVSYGITGTVLISCGRFANTKKFAQALRKEHEAQLRRFGHAEPLPGEEGPGFK